MTIGDIIILSVYIVGFFITFFYQKNKIGALKTQVDSQSGTISSMQRLVDLYDIDKIEKFVKLSEKTVLLEKKEEMKELEARAKKDIQELEATLKTKVGRTVINLTSDIYELLSVIMKISYNLVDYSYFEKAVGEMSDDSLKDNVKQILEKAKQEKAKREKEKRGTISNEVLAWFLQNPGFLQTSIAEGEKQKRADKEKD